ncbi:hypothetical protein [Streptomyces torulosus]|uniref:hypothetical protein n=1 Tax=Streptomyces torulosus TaxID=68276 RepID=UPI0006EB7B5C|nr:hypothetical protein [Streptomyces torulosus]
MQWVFRFSVALLAFAAGARALTTMSGYQVSWVPAAQAPWSALSGVASWVCAALSVAVIVVHTTIRRMAHYSDSWEIIYLMCLFLWAPCLLFLSIELLAAWTGAWVTWGAIFSILLVKGLANLHIGRRERNLANPFRGMLAVDVSEEGLSS